MKVYPPFNHSLMKEGCHPEDSKNRVKAALKCYQSFYDDIDRSIVSHKKSRHAFWQHFSERYGVTKEEKEWLQYQLRLRKNREMRKSQRSAGMTCRGNTVRGRRQEVQMSECTLKSLPNPLFAYIRPINLGYLTPTTMKWAKDVQDRLLLRLRGGAEPQVFHRKQANQGVSLGMRIAPGGKYARENRSGTCFMSSALSRKTTTGSVFGENSVKPHEWEKEELHDEVLDMVSTVITEAFGTSPWYKKLLSDLSKIPEDRLVSGVPCSSVWFTSNPKPHKWHVDTNTLGAVFAFCLETVEGGEVSISMPHQTVNVHLKEGMVLGGTWAQYPHCNLPLVPGSDRHSFIVYLDHRMLNSKYWTRNDFMSSNTKQIN